MPPAGAHIANANGPGAFAVSGSHARVKVTQNGNHWDQRPKTTFDRKEKNVAGWVELTAAVITLVAAGVTTFAAVKEFSTMTLVITAAVAVVVTLVVGFFAFHFTAARFRGHSIVQIGGWFLGVVLKEARGTPLLWVSPRAQCMWCPSHNPGVLKPQVIDGDPVWVCNRNPRLHRSTFDWTQI